MKKFFSSDAKGRSADFEAYPGQAILFRREASGWKRILPE
jgi:hypothetical protein